MDEVVVELTDVTVWADTASGKFPAMSTLEGNLVLAIQTEIAARLALLYDVDAWIDSSTTPSLIKKIIGMMYVAAVFQRTYADDNDISNYGTRLADSAEKLLTGLIAGSITLLDLPAEQDLAPGTNTAVSYPNDASSALTPTVDDPSLGGPIFSVGTIW